MSANEDGYRKQMQDVACRAAAMKKTLLFPALDDDRKLIANKKQRKQQIEGAVTGSIFESAGPGGRTIAVAAANELHKFCERHGRMPGDDLLASAHKSIENVLIETSKKRDTGMIMESADLTTTEGIVMRDRMVALVLPVMLQSISAQITSLIPGDYNRSEIFRVDRVAKSTFGDVTAGDILDHTFNGQYGTMDQRQLTGTGTGTVTGSHNEFDLVNASNMPIKFNSVKVIHDHNIVAKDDGVGNISGSFKLGLSTITVSGTVNYATGAVSPLFSAAPLAGIQVHIQYDVDIEQNPALIPQLQHEITARTLIPHESAIAIGYTLQALWGIRREYDLDADAQLMSSVRNLLAADKDRKNLRDLAFYAKGQFDWTYTVPAPLSQNEHFQSLLPVLLNMDAAMALDNGRAGMSGIICDLKSAAIIKAAASLAQGFKPAPGYVSIPQPHYAGRIFDLYDLYINPSAPDYTNIGFCKGVNLCESALITGDAIPAMAFRHAMQSDLRYNASLWELAYRDLQPFDGRKYVSILKFNP